MKSSRNTAQVLTEHYFPHSWQNKQDLADVARCNHTLISYSWVSLPLVYTQLVTLAVHLYFFFTLFRWKLMTHDNLTFVFSSQYLQPSMFTFDKESGSYTQVQRKQILIKTDTVRIEQRSEKGAFEIDFHKSYFPALSQKLRCLLAHRTQSTLLATTTTMLTALSPFSPSSSLCSTLDGSMLQRSSSTRLARTMKTSIQTT